MLFGLLVCSVLTQTSAGADRAPIGVVLSSKRAGAEQISKKLVDRVTAVLRKEGVGTLTADALNAQLKEAGLDDPRSCDGADGCLQKLAGVLGPHAVIIGVDVGKIQKNLAIHLSAMASDAAEPIAVQDFIAKEDKWLDQSNTPLLAFVHDLKANLKARVTPVVDTPADPPVKPVVRDVPVKKPDLTPDPTKEPEKPIVVKDPEKPGKGPLPWVLAGGAVAAVGTSITLGALGLQDRSRYFSAFEADGVTPKVSRTEFNQTYAPLAGSANTKLTAALITGVAGLALGGVSTWLFVKE